MEHRLGVSDDQLPGRKAPPDKSQFALSSYDQQILANGPPQSGDGPAPSAYSPPPAGPAQYAPPPAAYPPRYEPGPPGARSKRARTRADPTPVTATHTRPGPAPLRRRGGALARLGRDSDMTRT